MHTHMQTHADIDTPPHTHETLKYQDNDVPKFSASPWQTFFPPLCLGATTDLLSINIDSFLYVSIF